MQEGCQVILAVRVHPNYVVELILKRTEENEVKITFFAENVWSCPVEYDNFRVVSLGKGKIVITSCIGSSTREVDVSGITFQEAAKEFEGYIEGLITSGKMDFYQAIHSFRSSGKV